MRALGHLSLLAACAVCHVPPATPVSTAVSQAGVTCVLAPADSAWLAHAMSQWTRIGVQVLRLAPAPVPTLILFDDECAYDVNPSETWDVTGSAHGGSIPLPNGRTMRPRGVAITSPVSGDTGVFLAIALPKTWRSDPRYGFTDTRAGWERYLVGAFAHEMTHARMLPHMLPRLRAIEAAIFPDTVEDNAVQNRFSRDENFASSIRAEIELLQRAVVSTTPSTRNQYIRDALVLMRTRWERHYVGELASWAELEQAFLDLEGIAQWVAFHVRWGAEFGPSRAPGSVFERLLMRFRANREFWSEDQGLLMALALDATVPDWQRHIFVPNAPSTYELLWRAVARPR